MQTAGRLVCGHSADMVMEKLSPLLTEQARRDMHSIRACWQQLTSERFMPNDCFQDHRWMSLSAKEQHRMQIEGRQLVFRQIHDIVQGHVLYHLDGGVAQAVKQVDEESRLALQYRLLDDHRRQIMVEQSLRPQQTALPNFSADEAEEEAEQAENPSDQDMDYYQQPRGSAE